MLIEIHMIQNHSPSNLNRDDLGAPKTCVFGGVTRARISSQCLKRTIRRSSDFQQALEKDRGVRTRRLITILAERAHGSSPAPDDLIEFVANAFEKGGVKRKGTEEDANATNILMFLPESSIAAMAEDIKLEWQKKKPDPDGVLDKLTELLGKAGVPDIALCGRMTELDSAGFFRKIDFHVEAALSAAHAISTHEVVNEVDYFTAVDDKAKGTGAGYLDEAMYASACFYKHFCIDWAQLVKNLGDDDAARELARLTVQQFLRAAAMTTPTGKQKSFAAFNPPEGILVEVKKERCTPISYANAFADAVPRKCPRGLIGESIARLGQYVHELADGYGIKAERFWFSPAGRHPLTYVDAESKEGSVVDASANFRSFDELVARVIQAVAGKQPKAGALS
jgi:CRISPR system Cascade subunit CasC